MIKTRGGGGYFQYAKLSTGVHTPLNYHMKHKLADKVSGPKALYCNKLH